MGHTTSHVHRTHRANTTAQSRPEQEIKQRPVFKLAPPTANKTLMTVARGPGWCQPFTRSIHRMGPIAVAPVASLEEVSLEQHSSKEVHWCNHADCIESTESFRSAAALAVHTAEHHKILSRKKRRSKKERGADVESDSAFTSGSDTETTQTPIVPVATRSRKSRGYRAK